MKVRVAEITRAIQEPAQVQIMIHIEPVPVLMTQTARQEAALHILQPYRVEVRAVQALPAVTVAVHVHHHLLQAVEVIPVAVDRQAAVVEVILPAAPVHLAAVAVAVLRVVEVEDKL
jgi:hypothetical protein